ncbi:MULTISPECIES: glycosyltransferase family 9 protein [Sphingobacterium]|uniref:LPS biosynthesis glycosyltransferase n=4 Tax=Sphingobacterium multivorum TaxID=28454 RepID=A0A654DH52_SPHMU|nr:MULTISPECIES: glycosyltransferase family 9 protein [Sphingobacterium]HAE65686.1 LPS biosynthesis glycosyltransferase [Sphingobacterium sp.]QQT45660.1 glycosyltransferase family 9 protein [Sphingobacterium multivorum]SUJ27969.1 Lipopolysaccharide core heptosyltransferase rfaQ [Sphingobacterium multivorum]VXD05291.1 LPS biosynthesis glycosyltransferase [Sphingobacterium multivorum]HBI89317.1 LPS biosynthesis glycosyltransferase [Sphingobacterium sp.]
MFKIAIFRALQLGDLLSSIPAIRALKSHYPDARLYFIGLPHMRVLMERFDCIDEYVDFPGHPQLPEIAYNPDNLERFVKQMQAEKFDLLIQMQGDGTVVNDFLQNFAAKRLVGFQPTASIDNPDWMTYPGKLHEVNRHLALMEFLGLKIPNRTMYFPLFPEDWEAYRKIKAEINYPFVIIHVGSRDAKRRWPIENFGFLANLMQQMGYQIVLTGVSAEESLVNELQRILEGPVLNLCSRLDLGTLGCLLKESTLLVCNCTGISHIAAALEAKSVVISLDGEPERWGPLNTALHITFDLTKPIAIEHIVREIRRVLPALSVFGRNA